MLSKRRQKGEKAMKNVNDFPATAVAYNMNTQTISATMDLGRGYPKPIAVTVPIKALNELTTLDTKGMFAGSHVLSEERKVIFKNARYTHSDLNGSVYYYEADSIELV
jgi:hypothetical protein